MRTKTVPVLKAEHIIKGSFYDSDDIHKHCLLGWLIDTFDEDTADYKAAEEQILSIIEEESIVMYNDYPLRTNKEIAQTWNKAMSKLGYDVKGAK